MKRAFAFSLVFLVLAKVFFTCGVLVHYQLNKAYITQKLCENKNKPASKCEGKCYLSKKIKAQSEMEKNIPNWIKALEEYSIQSNSFLDNSFFELAQFQTPQWGHHSFFVLEQTLSLFSPPPQV